MKEKHDIQIQVCANLTFYESFSMNCITYSIADSQHFVFEARSILKLTL
jgi:hypothetical protein